MDPKSYKKIPKTFTPSSKGGGWQSYVKSPQEFDARIATMINNMQRLIYGNLLDKTEETIFKIEMTLEWLRYPSTEDDISDFEGTLFEKIDLQDKDAIRAWMTKPTLKKRFLQKIYWFLKPVRDGLIKRWEEHLKRWGPDEGYFLNWRPRPPRSGKPPQWMGDVAKEMKEKYPTPRYKSPEGTIEYK
jgi:hypothetical protein